MGKRKNKYTNKSYHQLMLELEECIRELDWCVGYVASIFNWNDSSYGSDYVKSYIDFAKEHKTKALELTAVLKAIIPKEEIIINPSSDKKSKGKGKLNLHELDRELRLRQLDFREK